MNIEQAKTIHISVILDKINCPPHHENNTEVWYLSPLRNEKTPSFHIHKLKNVWYDFGAGIGGDIIDFVRAYLDSQNENHDVSDALRWIKNMAGFVPTIKSVDVEDFSKQDQTLVLKNTYPIKHLALIRYAESRGIPETVARQYLQEAQILNNQTRKTFFALCLQNEDKGYDLRNPFFKGCVGKKTITFIRGTIPKPDGIHLFEGIMDYLSIVTQQEGRPFNDDAIILNSLNCLKQGTAYIKNYGYKAAYTWMDNDKPGKDATQALDEFLKTEENLVHMPMNNVYEPFKDVNAWHMKTLDLS